MKIITKNYFKNALAVSAIICLDFLLVKNINSFISVFIINTLLIIPLLTIYSTTIGVKDENCLVIKNLFKTFGIVKLEEESVYMKIFEIKKFKFLNINFIVLECKNSDRTFKVFCKNTEEVMNNIVDIGNKI